MIEARLNLVNALGPAFFADLQKQFEEKVGKKMASMMDPMLDEKIRQSPDSPYTLEVDYQPVRSRQEFINARRRIRAYFIQDILSLSISAVKWAVRSSIQIYGADKRGDWANESEIVGGVSVFYGESGKPIREIGMTEIDSFRPGDVVLIVPKYGTQVYFSASKYGARGVFSKAARAVRRALKITGKNKSAIKVSAQRSRAAFYKMMQQSAPRRPDGSDISMTVPKPGMDSLWTIAIRYSRNFKGAVYG